MKFTWTEGRNINEYHLTLGTTPGSADIADQSAGDLTARSVSGLPTDGRRIYATLRSRYGDSWLETTSVFVAHTKPEMHLEPKPPPIKPPDGPKPTPPAEPELVQLPTIRDPAPGSTLSGGSVQFSWTGGSAGASAYRLLVGSRPEQSDLANVELGGDATSHSVRLLPTDGRRIYVSLHSLINGEWLPWSTEYTACTWPPKLERDPKLLIVVLEKLNAGQAAWRRGGAIEMRIREELTRAGASVLSRLADDENDAQAILERARDHDCDIIVLGRAVAEPTGVARGGRQTGWHNWQLSLQIELHDVVTQFELGPVVVPPPRRPVAQRSAASCEPKAFDDEDMLEDAAARIVEQVNANWTRGKTRPHGTTNAP